MGPDKVRPHKQRPLGQQFNYRDVRAQIQTGDVFLFQGTSALSRFIRWGSKSAYSHAGIALWSHHRLMVIQAAHRGVEILPASTAVDRYDGQVDWWRPTEAVHRQVRTEVLIHAAFDELGKPYGVWPLIALVARMVRGEDLGNPDPTSDETYFCSQLVSRCYRKAGADLVSDRADCDTSPGDLARAGSLAFCGVLRRFPGGLPVAELPPPPLTEARAPRNVAATASQPLL